jgi:hypothetical protein
MRRHFVDLLQPAIGHRGGKRGDDQTQPSLAASFIEGCENEAI